MIHRFFVQTLFNLGTQEFDMKEVINRNHPPIVRVMACEPDQGEHPRGCIVAKNATGNIVQYNPAASAPLNIPVGVLTDICRSGDGDNTAKVLVHGTVNNYALVVGESGTPDEADLSLLHEIGIFEIDDGGL